jgi:hypothetical protein
LDHLKGKHILGVYPLLKDNTCHFIASDFDNHNDGGRNPLEDVKAYWEPCQLQHLPCYVLRSKSGAGYHAYLFFETAVPAWKARRVAFALLQEAGVIGENVELSSFDRLFPNQDESSGKGFGNLIALPFQGRAVKEGHTLLLDPNNGFKEPFQEQWGALAALKRVPEARLDELIEEWDLNPHEVPSGGSAAGGSNGKVREKIMGCAFVKWCKDQPAKVPEPLWYALISNLVCLRPGGYSLCHELSKGYPGYNPSETDMKIHQAMDASGPHTCGYIRRMGFDCPQECPVRAPAALAFQKTGDPRNDSDSRIEVHFG